MTGFFRAVWDKITRTPAYVTEKLVTGIEYTAHLTSCFLATIGSLLTRGSRKVLEAGDRSTRWLERVILHALNAVLRFSFRIMDAARRVTMVAICVLHNIVTTLGLVLQTPYLALISRELLRQSWKQQFRTFFFLDGVTGRCTAAVVTMDHYREGVATREAAAREKAQAARAKKRAKKTPVVIATASSEDAPEGAPPTDRPRTGRIAGPTPVPAT
jgi:hypothetical protein